MTAEPVYYACRECIHCRVQRGISRSRSGVLHKRAYCSKGVWGKGGSLGLGRVLGATVAVSVVDGELVVEIRENKWSQAKTVADCVHFEGEDWVGMNGFPPAGP